MLDNVTPDKGIICRTFRVWNIYLKMSCKDHQINFILFSILLFFPTCMSLSQMTVAVLSLRKDSLPESVST